MITLDFETCGLHGVPVFLQWAENDGEINLVDLWKIPVSESLQLIEYISERDVCGFNLAFDWFHMYKWFTMCSLALEDKGDILPEDHIEDFAHYEEQGRFYDFVIKPKRAMDLMLHARKGPYQSLMARKDIKIKRVPTALAFRLADELEQRIEIDGIYFSRRKDKYAPVWRVDDIEDDPDFKNVVLHFSASSGLKVLAEHALGVKPDTILKFADVECATRPAEVGWAPYALAISKAPHWTVRKHYVKGGGYSWPKHVKQHITHWAYNTLARKYATNDVEYTRQLYEHFGCPEFGDDDSELACMVAVTRWRGFKINTSKIRKLRSKAVKKQGSYPQAPVPSRRYIAEVMDDIERTFFDSTGKEVLEKIEKWECDCQTEVDDDLLDGIVTDAEQGPEFDSKITEPLDPSTPCQRCGGSGVHPAAERAKHVLQARKGKKEQDLYDKLLTAGRFHASFKVIGTLSSRMSGTDGLNPQAINRQTEVRECFDLADDGFVLCGGDFDSFEVVIMLAAYPDKKLEELVKGGKKIHALFAMEMFPGMSYDDVMATKGTEDDKYGLGKNGVFTMGYGGNWATLVRKYGVEEEAAKQAEENWNKRYPDMAAERQKIFDMFCSMRQPRGIGTQVIWHEPAEYVESIFGFRRYFTLENKICKSLFELAQKPPTEWNDVKIKVVRRDREQTARGATSSALYAAAFAIQSAAMRAAANHRIQSSGATATKRVQRRVWDIQPSGISRWRLYGMNIHDELMVCARPDYQVEVGRVIDETVESFREDIPLIKFEFERNMETWAEK